MMPFRTPSETGQPGLHWRDPIDEQSIELPTSSGVLSGMMYRIEDCGAAIVYAQPSGIGRLRWRERYVALALARAGFATFLVDLLTDEEDAARQGAHDDIPLLADRLLTVADWWTHRGPPLKTNATSRFPLGYFGVGSAASAALVATAMEPDRVLAVVARGSRPDGAGASLLLTRVPSLFLVAGNDKVELAANRAACGHSGHRRFEVVPSASGEFAENDALQRVVSLSTAWFGHWLDPLYMSHMGQA